MKKLILCFILCGNLLSVSAACYQIKVFNYTGETLDYKFLINENEFLQVTGHQSRPFDGAHPRRLHAQSENSGSFMLEINGVQFTIDEIVNYDGSVYEIQIHLTKVMDSGNLVLSGTKPALKVVVFYEGRMMNHIIEECESKRQS